MTRFSCATWTADVCSSVSSCKTTDRRPSTVVAGVKVVGCSVGRGVVGVVGDMNGADVGRGAPTLVLWSESEDFAHAKPAAPAITRPATTPATIARLRFGDRVDPGGGGEADGSGATRGCSTVGKAAAGIGTAGVGTVGV